MVDLSPWKKVKARFEAGERVPPGVRRMAEEVLQERFIRRDTTRTRPDYRDRAAGDDSVGQDDEGVALL